jgi:aryl-alcohol dehydrogenase-like predicted oxidoreductase
MENKKSEITPETRNLGKTGELVTFLGFGALEIGRDWGYGADRRRPDETAAAETLNAVLDMGINLIDTAAAYHLSEARIGKAVSHRRKDFFLASKCGEHNREPHTYYDFSYQAVKKSIDESLDKLKTTTIDLMQIHFGPDPHKVLDRGDTLQAMQDAQKEGKIRFLGASAWSELGWRCLEMDVFDVLQLDYHLLHRDDEKLIHAAAQRGVGILIRTGLGRGIYTQKALEALPQLSPSVQKKLESLLKLTNNDTKQLLQIALNFLKSNHSISSVLLGSRKAEHIQENLHLLQTPLDHNLFANALEIALAP